MGHIHIRQVTGVTYVSERDLISSFLVFVHRIIIFRFLSVMVINLHMHLISIQWHSNVQIIIITITFSGSVWKMVIVDMCHILQFVK